MSARGPSKRKGAPAPSPYCVSPNNSTSTSTNTITATIKKTVTITTCIAAPHALHHHMHCRVHRLHIDQLPHEINHCPWHQHQHQHHDCGAWQGEHSTSHEVIQDSKQEHPSPAASNTTIASAEIPRERQHHQWRQLEWADGTVAPEVDFS
jgi:hypothetical protein